MNNEKCNAHGKDHRDQCQPVKRTDDKSQRTDHFAEDCQRQRSTAADPERIGEHRGHRIEITPLGNAMRKQQSAENHAGCQQNARCLRRTTFRRK